MGDGDSVIDIIEVNKLHEKYRKMFCVLGKEMLEEIEIAFEICDI